MESNNLEKFTNKSVASKIFAWTPFKIRRIVRICNVMDWFLQKHFLSFPKNFLNFSLVSFV